MFYLNEKNIKEYTVVGYLASEKFKTQIRPRLFKLIKPSWKNQTSLTPLFLTSTKIVDSLGTKLDEETLQKITNYFSYLGKWSEFFLEKLVATSKEKQKSWEQIELQDHWEIVREATEESKKYFASKKSKSENWVWFWELSNPNKYKYSFFYEQESFKNNEDFGLFTVIMNHWKSFLPHFESCISWNKFTKLYELKSSEHHKQECEITRWEFDFFEPNEKELVELKFHKKSWNTSWIWQTLMYSYLLDFYYGVRVKKIRIINTFFGEQLSFSISDLFIEGGEESFYKMMKLEISDYEKLKFMNRILACFKEWTTNSNLKEIISNNFFCEQEDLNIPKYHQFITNLDKNRGRANFLSNIHSPKWVWSEWIKFSAQTQ
ncbi:hypothetical protein WEN_02855 [Mycoplasma wenyonii str. Massachusetts]|uniref:Uncharacterized protein n=1 Tax=Mycoplasma wenyonii (strain Massachusetts) TaxID=1197325 RepID=I6YM33_MYCWM|nr:hypothetical protein [Mycoplasma wenyonii]AFN65354.1 hypothetical protein WEN_02855 [Mycoplasma wenyonii str. Massachusetts]